jgi:hypothetical protein
VPVTVGVRHAGVREVQYGGIPHMPVELNHTIVHARNNRESAEFLTGILDFKPKLRLI